MSATTTHVGSEARARNQGPRGLLDRFLGLFADVRGGEGLTALLLMANIFLLLAGYYMLKVIREPLILTVPGGAEIKSYASAIMAGLFLVIVPGYSALAARVSRVKLINGVTAFFAACLVAFFLLNNAGVPIGVAFFVWLGIFNMMIIAQMWAFANDVYTVEQGKRLFAIVGVGASLGAIAGSFATGELVEQYGPYPFMLGAGALLLLCMVLTNWINVREKRRAAGRRDTPGDRGARVEAPAAPEGSRERDLGVAESRRDRDGEDRIRGRSGFALVFADRYLLLIGIMMLILNFVNTNGEYILGKVVVNDYIARHGQAAIGDDDAKKVIGGFYGNFQTWVNVISFLLQAFVVSRILKYLGVRTALFILPIVSLIGYSAMAFFPVMAFIRGTKIAENSLDYSVQNTTRHALYLPTSREAKYKAKQANDTFFVRLGDVFSAGLVFAGATWLALAPAGFALVNVALVVIWLVIAVFLGIGFRRKTEQRASVDPSEKEALASS